jgi:hypothetical protein
MTVFNLGYRGGCLECAYVLEIKAIIFYFLNGIDIPFDFEGPCVFKGLHLEDSASEFNENA